jgi:hypothetical protein
MEAPPGIRRRDLEIPLVVSLAGDGTDVTELALRAGFMGIGVM